MEIGGQAVIEGVMMRSPNYISISTLKKNKIKTKVIKKPSLTKKYEKLYFLRGILSLYEMLIIGSKALIYSAKQQEDEGEKISNKEIALMFIFALVFSIGLFVVLPFYVAKLISIERLWFNILDGVLRVLFFLIYIVIISYMKDIKRVFQFHGAEHKAVHCYEAKKKLTINNVKKYTTLHPRCGTSFIVIVLILSIIIFSLLWVGTWYLKLLLRVVLIPVIVGVSYEILKISAKFEDNFIVGLLIKPGLWIQKITTKEPDKKQMEVGIEALKAVLKKEKA